MSSDHNERWLYLHKARQSFDFAKTAADPERVKLHMEMHRLYLSKVDELYDRKR